MCITCEGFCMGTGCQILVLIAKPNFVFFVIQFCFAECILGSEWGWQRGWQQLCWAELLGWGAPPETPWAWGPGWAAWAGPDPTDHCQPSPAQFPSAPPHLLWTKPTGLSGGTNETAEDNPASFWGRLFLSWCESERSEKLLGLPRALPALWMFLLMEFSSPGHSHLF